MTKFLNKLHINTDYTEIILHRRLVNIIQYGLLVSHTLVSKDLSYYLLPTLLERDSQHLGI